MFDRVEFKLRAGMVALLFMVLAAPALLAQDEEGTPREVERAVADAQSAAESPELAGLAAEIEARFEVLPIRDGLILRPRSAGTGILSVEITSGELAIDGEPVSRSEARSRLGSDARAVLRLADLDPERARELFRIGPPPPRGPGVGAEMPEPPEAPEAPEIPPPRPPRPPRNVEAGSGQRLNFFSDVTVRSGESVDEAVSIGGSVTVDGNVAEDAVAVGGSNRVNGNVGGTVAAIGGSVFLGPDAVVGGDVLSVGGTVVRADGAQVGGQVIQVSASKGLFGGRSWSRHGEEEPSRWFRGEEVSDLVTGVIVFGVFLLLFWLIFLIAPEPLGRVSDRVRRDFWSAALAGLLTAVLFVPVFALVLVVLAISIVGIPLILLMPFVVLLFLVGILMGYAAVSLAFGRLLERSFGWRLGSPYLVILVGAAVLELFIKLGDLIDVIGPLSTPAWILLAVGWGVRLIAALIGLGAVVLTRFGTWPRREAAAAPATPPIAPPPPADAPPEEAPEPWTELARDDDWPPPESAADDDSEPRT